MPNSIFFPRRGGDSNLKVSQTRATTDKNDPFLNMGFKHGKKWVDKNGAKCNMGFGRITKNTPGVYTSVMADFGQTDFGQTDFGQTDFGQR